MNIAFLLYPVHKVKVDEDSSFWMMRELQKRGHSLSYFESKDLFWEGREPKARLHPARLDEKRGFLPSPLARAASRLASTDALIVRKEPPFDEEYLHTLHLLSPLRGRVFMMNDPEGIANCNEKLSVLSFPQFIPETLVTSSADEARTFARRLKREVVVKPLDQKGGYGIFKSRSTDKGFHARLFAATLGGQRQVLVQRFLPECYTEDKRILILDGEILGAFLRKPARGEFRANLGLGGSMHRTALTRRERKLAETAAPWLSERGLHFTGLDSIGGYLGEINVTSPSGIPEMRQLYGSRLERKIAAFIEQRCL
jgi:glutathione synthase